jgi:hypothetical protein
MRTLSVAVVTIAAAAAFAAGSAHAAVPRIVIFSGKPVAHQVVISDWQAIFRIVEYVLPARAAPRAEPAGRPRLKVSTFWGPRWIDYLNEGKRASALRPGQADQFGTFYPVWRGRPALIDLPGAGQSPRVVPPQALAILKRFDVPTKLVPGRPVASSVAGQTHSAEARGSTIWILIVVPSSLAVAGLLAAALVRRRRRSTDQQASPRGVRSVPS